MSTDATHELSATSSRMIPEPLYGTLSEVDIYFLLEYNGVWGSHVTDDHSISPEVMTALRQVKGAKTLFIRQPGQSGWADNKISFYVAVASSAPPRLYSIELQSYEHLLDLNLAEIIAGDFTEPTTEPLYAVCTNGKRDICCSKYGVALAEAMAQEVGSSVWRISHLGGHRFAATMLCLPYGIGYGYLDAAHASQVIESYTNQDILLDHYRGRSTYPQPAQAADYFLRKEKNLVGIDAVRYLRLEETAEKQWQVLLETTHDAADFLVDVQQVMSEYTVVKTSGDEQAVHVPRFKLIGIKQE